MCITVLCLKSFVNVNRLSQIDSNACSYSHLRVKAHSSTVRYCLVLAWGLKPEGTHGN